MPPVTLSMLQTNILHVLFYDSQATISKMESDLQEALLMFNAILKNISKSFTEKLKYEIR